MTKSMDDAYIDAVLTVVERLEAGQVATYGAVAAAVGRGGPRQVGRVMRLHGDQVAWWRVVRADGTPPSCHGGTAPARLRAEGVRFRSNGKVELPGESTDGHRRKRAGGASRHPVHVPRGVHRPTDAVVDSIGPRHGTRDGARDGTHGRWDGAVGG